MPNPCEEGVGEMVCGGIASTSMCCGAVRSETSETAVAAAGWLERAAVLSAA